MKRIILGSFLISVLALGQPASSQPDDDHTSIAIKCEASGPPHYFQPDKPDASKMRRIPSKYRTIKKIRKVVGGRTISFREKGNALSALKVLSEEAWASADASSLEEIAALMAYLISQDQPMSDLTAEESDEISRGHGSWPLSSDALMLNWLQLWFLTNEGHYIWRLAGEVKVDEAMRLGVSEDGWLPVLPVEEFQSKAARHNIVRKALQPATGRSIGIPNVTGSSYNTNFVFAAAVLMTFDEVRRSGEFADPADMKKLWNALFYSSTHRAFDSLNHAISGYMAGTEEAPRIKDGLLDEWFMAGVFSVMSGDFDRLRTILELMDYQNSVKGAARCYAEEAKAAWSVFQAILAAMGAEVSASVPVCEDMQNVARTYRVDATQSSYNAAGTPLGRRLQLRSFDPEYCQAKADWQKLNGQSNQ